MPEYFRCPECNKYGLHYIEKDKLKCKYCKFVQGERRKAERRQSG
jgi:ribosomal protein L44E